MDLIPAELGFGEPAGNHNRPAGGIHLDGVLKGLGSRVAEQLLQHLDHVIVGVEVVVRAGPRGTAAPVLRRSAFSSSGGAMVLGASSRQCLL